MAAKNKSLVRIISASDLYSSYLKAGKNPSGQKKVLSEIIKLVLKDPESKYSETLIKIAKKGDSRCSLAISPLMEIFWDGDFEWQEEVVKLLGEISHLAPLPLRIKVGLFLGHVAVSSEFCGGSGVDYDATVALSRIASNLFLIEKARLMKSKKWIVYKEGESRRRFDAETKRPTLNDVLLTQGKI